MSTFDLYDRKLAPSSPPELVEGEAHAKLKRNLSLALDRHHEIMADTLPPDMPPQTRRLVLEAANTTVKAALTTDRTALKARQDNSLERVFLRALFHLKRLGRELSREDEERLKTASRTDLEASLGPRQLTEYDEMMNAASRAD